MKIELKNIKKDIGDDLLFSIDNIEISEHGFYTFVGDSGSGKSTLLNILGLLDANYEGTYLLDSINTKSLKEKDKNKIQALNFSYVFQSYNLLENDTVINNVLLVCNNLLKQNKEYIDLRIDELLELLGIRKLKHEYVKNLSGGEKQRVGIVRALITSPNIIFCDEPSGALDKINGDFIFKILKQISNDAIVICVTHDKELANRYLDRIFEFSNKKVVVKSNKKNKLYDSICISKIFKKEQAKLSFKFIFQHIKNKIKLQKFRNILKNLLLSTSLITSGISLSLSINLNNTISNAFNNLVDQNSVIMTKKNGNCGVFDYYCAGDELINDIVKDYSDDIDYYGINYFADFENFFPDENALYILNENRYNKINGFTIRMFNEFILKNNQYTEQIYPQSVRDLDDDELIISITHDQMKEICLLLKIIRTFENLGKYLSSHKVFLTIRLRNNSWDYYDEQIFRLRGVVLSNKNRVIHSNPLFNECLFEEMMRFPTSNKINKEEQFPWTLKKMYYIHTKKYQTYFMNKIFYDEKYKDLIFESDKKRFSPLSCSNNNCSTNKIFVFNSFGNFIDKSMIKKVKTLGFDFEDYYFSSDLGYLNNGTSIFNGFARPSFFSCDINKIESIIDTYSKIETDELSNLQVPEGVLDAYAFNPNKNNIKFSPIKEEFLPNEIIISEGIRKLLHSNSNEIYVTMLRATEENATFIRNEFSTIKLRIKRVIENDESITIYQNGNFTISLFRDLFKISSLYLVPTSIVFKTKSRMDFNKLNNLREVFPQYNFVNPIENIENSIDDSTIFLKFILNVFSLTTILITILLMLIITTISTIQNHRENAIFKVLGFNNITISSIYLIENLYLGVQCFCISSLSLFLINFLLSKILDSFLCSSYMI